MEDLSARITKVQLQHRYRQLQSRDGPQDHTIIMNGRSYLNFCSNDYLGLSNHPKLKAAFIQAVQTYGVGSGSSHLINGHTTAHAALEEALAAFTGRAKALLYSTGYMANLGVISALLGPGDGVFEDRLNHASLLDAGLLSKARFQRYAHVDVGALRQALHKSNTNEKLIVTDGVFSMEGDVAPLRALSSASRDYQAWLMVDDAHGFGVFGQEGGGVLEAQGLSVDDVPILMATLGKAFGTSGAFVAGSEALIDTLIQQSRTYIYTTAMPPAIAAATLTSLQLLKEEGWRRQHLKTLIQVFTERLSALGLPVLSHSAIQPIILGSEQATLEASQQLAAQGIMVSAIRPPTVPKNSARLRMTLSAFHSLSQVEQLLETITQLPCVKNASIEAQQVFG